MLPKSHRIDKKLFTDVFKKGRSVYSDFLSLKILQIPEKNIRFAFVVPIKVSKKAVERNKIKRRARYVVRKNLSSLRHGNAVIAFLKTPAKTMKFKELEQEILSILKKTKLLN